MKKRTVLLIVVLALALGATVLLPVMSISKYSSSAKTFEEDGYILVANTDGSSEAINSQYYFNAGETYRESYDDSISFNDINGTKVSAEKENFLHYSSGSMNSLSTSVLLDTDHVTDEQVDYYSISPDTTLSKASDTYKVNNAGENLSFTNFIWKVSDSQYMIVSSKIKYVANDNEEMSYDNYVEVQYIDEGVVHLVNQSGTYSTISSDAYLELENGIRVYVGSKNVSDSEGILMNMTQMVVDSDDNIEVAPDEEYKNENPDQPQIIVNATDGATGDAGQAGDNGENGDNGDNGNPGQRGNQGPSGTEGNSAENSDVTYVAEKMPVFSNVVLTPSAYGVDFSMNYSDNNCSVSDAWISIREDATGLEVWKYNIYSLLSSSLSLSDVCNVLTQSTTYSFNIGCTYTSGTQQTAISQIVYSQKFITDSLGISLSKLYATSSSIVVKLAKDSATDIQTVKVAGYDSDMQPINYGTLSTDDNVNTFDMQAINAGEYYEVVFNNLTYDSVYYMQIEVKGMAVDPNSGQAYSITLLPTNSFTKQEYMTLKREPSIGVPTIEISEETSSFLISPGSVIDRDNGITSYRYELYEAENYTADSEPIYVGEKSTPAQIAVEIDGTIVKRNTPYIAKMVVSFYNNDETIEYESEVSNTITAGISIWPTVLVAYDSDLLLPASIEGTLKINDASDTLANSTITVVYKTSLPESTQLSEDKRNVDVTYGTFNLNSYTKIDGIYSIPLSLKALKGSQTYTIWVTADKVTTRDSQNVATVYNNALIGTDTFTTPAYDALDVKLTDVNDASLKISYMLNLESQYLANEVALDEKTYSSSIKLDSLGDSAGKSVTYMKIGLYKSNAILNSDGETYTYTPIDSDTGKLGEYVIVDENDKTSISTEYATNYSFNSSIYERAYRQSTKDSENNAYAGLTVNEETARTYEVKTAKAGDEVTVYLGWDSTAAVPETVTEITSTYATCEPTITRYESYYKITFTMPSHMVQFDVSKKLNNVLSSVATVTVDLDGQTGGGSNNESYYLTSAYKNNPIIIDDDKFTTGGVNPLNQVTEGEVLFIKVTMYDYAYGLGSAYNTNGVSTNIPTKEEWIQISAKAKLPTDIDDEDYCGDTCKLTKFKATSNLASDSGYYNNESGMTYAHPNNVVTAVDEPSGNYYTYLANKWDDIIDSTYVGVAYRGPQILASYCSSGESVQYIVYADADRTQVVATSGWLTYNYDATHNYDMPEWTFFLDVRDETTMKYIERGDSFYIETKIKMKGYNDNVFPDYFIQNNMLASTFKVLEKYTLDKQEPTINMIPYDCDTTDVNYDVLHYIYNDPDLAFDYNDVDTENYKLAATETHTFTLKWDSSATAPGYIEEANGKTSYFAYSPVLDKTGALTSYEVTITNMPAEDLVFNIKESNTSATNLAVITVSNTAGSTNDSKYKFVDTVSSIKFYNANIAGHSYETGSTAPVTSDGFYSLTCELPQTGYVNTKYTLNTAATPKTKNLVSEEGYVNQSKVTLLETSPKDGANGFYEEWKNDEKTFAVHFLYETHDKSDQKTNKELLGIDLIFTNDQDQSISLFYIELNQENVVSYTYTVGSEQVTAYYYDCRIDVDTTLLASIINGGDISYQVVAYYDSCYYGYKYLETGSKSPGQSTSSIYYLKEKLNDEHKGNFSSASIDEFPDSCYASKSITDGRGKAATTYLNSKEDTLNFNMTKKKITFDNSDYSFDSYGIVDYTIKNVTSTTLSTTTDKLTFALPLYTEVNTTVGFSQFALDFNITAGHTLYQDDGMILRVKKKSESTYTDVNISMGDNQTAFSVTATGLSSKTEYEYSVWGYVNDGGNKTLKNISGTKTFTTIAEFAHYKKDTLEIVTKPTSRNSKTAVYTLNICGSEIMSGDQGTGTYTGVIKDDILACLDSVTVELKDSNDTTIQSVTVNSAQLESAFTLREGSSSFGDIVYEVEFAFDPTKRDTSNPTVPAIHEIAGTYKVKTTYNYKAPYNASTDTPQTLSYDLNSFLDTNVSFTMVATKGISTDETDPSHPVINYYLDFAISGWDTKRLVPEYNGKQYYIIELREHTDSGDEVVYDSANSVYARKLVEATVNTTSGRITTSESKYTFNNLKAGSEYILYLYTYIDINNVNLSTWDALVNPTTFLTEITTQENPSMLTVASGTLEDLRIYTKKSIYARTDDTSDILASSMVLAPSATDQTKNMIVGKNLNKVSKIVYAYRIGNDTTGTVTINQSEIAGKFVSVTSDLYYLTLPEINDPDESYYVRVDFYKNSSDENPATTIDAVWNMANSNE